MEKRNLEPGMDESQAQKDRAGWKTTVQNTTGGEHDDLFTSGEHAGGPVVGNQYDWDPLGEERSDDVTHGQGDMSGTVGRPIKNDAVGKR